MTKPYPQRKILPKLKAEQKRLERMATSALPEAAAKYIGVACQKLGKAITLMEKELGQ